jgi:hypothetical protein
MEEFYHTEQMSIMEECNKGRDLGKMEHGHVAGAICSLEITDRRFVTLPLHHSNIPGLHQHKT